jgi:hypothetical protein
MRSRFVYGAEVPGDRRRLACEAIMIAISFLGAAFVLWPMFH